MSALLSLQKRIVSLRLAPQPDLRTRHTSASGTWGPSSSFFLTCLFVTEEGTPVQKLVA